MKKVRLIAAVMVGMMALTNINVGFANTQYYNSDENIQTVQLMNDESLMDGDYSYIENEDGSVTIEHYFGEETEVTIPSELGGKQVTVIGEDSFLYYEELTKVIIPDGIITISDGAFGECCNLTNITIPSSVEVIGNSVFYGCTNLKNIEVDQNNKNYCSVDGILFSEDEKTIIKYPQGKESEEYSIPEGVICIDDGVFKHCESLLDITIPNSVVSIGDEAFAYCTALVDITIPDSVVSIGDEAFLYCENLTNITLANGLKNIGDYVFYECTNLNDIIIPDTVNEIGAGVFSYTGIYNNEENWENGVLYIDKYLIGTQGYYSIEGEYIIKDGTICIAAGAFSEEGIEKITIPDSVTSICDGAFEMCTELTSVIIPESATKLGSSAFAYCENLTEVTIPEGVTVIEDSIFYDCASLTSVTIPEGVTNIGDEAFYGCISLTDITIPEKVTSIGNSAFYECSSLTNINIPEKVSSIGEFVFRGCTNLKDIIIPQSVTNIGMFAFDKCDSLTSIVVPDGVTSIKDGTFSYCRRLTSIELPDSVVSIGDEAFYGCVSLPEFKIPSGVTSIGMYAFSGCVELQDIKIPDGVTEIKEGTFSGCYGLEYITIPNGVISIGYCAFNSCGLSGIIIPSSVTEINRYAFYTEFNYGYIPSVMVYGEIGSYAEEYCYINDMRFSTISQPEYNNVSISPLIESEIHIEEDIIEVPVNITSIGVDGGIMADVYVVAYKDEKMTGISTRKIIIDADSGYDGYIALYDIIETSDSIKVFVFDRENGITPLCEAATAEL